MRLSILVILLFHFLLVSNAQSSFESQLSQLPEIKSIEKIENHSFFKETYVVYFEQFLDHQRPERGTFLQRVILSNYAEDQPVVFVTEGYGANYATRKSYINELTGIIKANQVVVEHRYFGKSLPDSMDWNYLTIKSATDDLHQIYLALQNVYTKNNKWVATGISKGGQNTFSYKAFYPNDMDVWVPYVGPVNMQIEDKRMERFIRKVSSKSDREKVRNFQLDILENRQDIQPLLDSLILANKYTYHISNDVVLDYVVLEYSFAFWQWGHALSDIPSPTASLKDKFKHLTTVSSPDYFSLEGIAPIKTFFVQTVKDFGYYGYSTKEFKPYMVIDNAENYIQEVIVPDIPAFKFTNTTSRFIRKAIRKDGEHVLMIYGEFDPWTAGGIKPGLWSKAHRFVKKGGSHRTRINNMPDEQNIAIKALLDQWIGLN